MELDQIKDKDCFNVPDEYFDELPKIVMNKITKQKKVVHWQRAIIAVSSVAASLLLIVGIINLRPSARETMTAKSQDSVLKPAVAETILTAEIQPAVDVVEDNSEEVSAQAEVSSADFAKKTTKSVSRKSLEQLEDADYQVVDMYQEEIDMNEYLLSLY